MMNINVLQYLESSVNKVPDKIAFTDQKNQITYKELGLSSKRIGSEIYRKTNGQIRRPIVVFVDRNIESLVAFMAVAYSGNFYVPIDIQMPTSRVELILETLQPLGMIVTKESKSFSEKVAPKLIAIDYEEYATKGTIDEEILKEYEKLVKEEDWLDVLEDMGYGHEENEIFFQLKREGDYKFDITKDFEKYFEENAK